jgi:hypothetical protein
MRSELPELVPSHSESSKNSKNNSAADVRPHGGFDFYRVSKVP